MNSCGGGGKRKRSQDDEDAEGKKLKTSGFAFGGN